MSRKIKVGISTCPNDTFAFHAIMTGAVTSSDFEFDVELLDIQQLNEKLFDSEFEIAKASFHAALLLADRMYVLPAGSALGFGVGPLLLSSDPDLAQYDGCPFELIAEFESTRGRLPVVLCPGKHTTATLLFRLFFTENVEIRQVVFSEIMPKLQAGEADFGVCIHEGRFTWQQSGLGLVADLGEVWESATDAALPLGGLLGSKDLDTLLLRRASRLIRESIEFGLANRDQTLTTMRKYAQEFSDDVLMSHVDLYVNQWTLDLGEMGCAALRQLSQRAMERRFVTDHFSTLEILDESVD